MNPTENKQEEQSNKLVQLLLDKYFELRSPYQESGMVREDKTTLQIQDELLAMQRIDVYDIATYMLNHKYVPTTEADGTLAWEIYRLLVMDD